jgi:hypothetical protein
VLVYAYIDVPRIGPIPAMYDAVWYTEKTISAIGEGAAFVAALILVFLPWDRRRSSRTAVRAEHRSVNP